MYQNLQNMQHYKDSPKLYRHFHEKAYDDFINSDFFEPTKFYQVSSLSPIYFEPHKLYLEIKKFSALTQYLTNDEIVQGSIKGDVDDEPEFVDFMIHGVTQWNKNKSFLQEINNYKFEAQLITAEYETDITGENYYHDHKGVISFGAYHFCVEWHGTAKA